MLMFVHLQAEEAVPKEATHGYIPHNTTPEDP